MSQDKLSDRLRELYVAMQGMRTWADKAFEECIAEAEALEWDQGWPVAWIDDDTMAPCPFCGGDALQIEVEPQAYCIECTACQASSKVVYFLMDDGSTILREAWNQRASGTAAHPPKEAPAPTARVLTDEEIERIIDSTETDLRIVHGDARFDPATFAHECFRYARDNGYLSSPKPQVSVDEIMEFLEDYIEEGINEMHDNQSVHGWQYDPGHPNWNATMNDLRDRLTKLMDR